MSTLVIDPSNPGLLSAENPDDNASLTELRRLEARLLQRKSAEVANLTELQRLEAELVRRRSPSMVTSGAETAHIYRGRGIVEARRRDPKRGLTIPGLEEPEPEPDRIMSAYKRGKSLARHYGLFEWEEDMAQQAVLAELEGNHVVYRTIDWLRKFLGTRKQREKRSYIPIEELYDSHVPRVYQEHNFEMADFLLDLKCDLSERDFKIIELVFVEDYSQAEVARMVGLTESRICQIITLALSSNWVQRWAKERRAV